MLSSDLPSHLAWSPRFCLSPFFHRPAGGSLQGLYISPSTVAPQVHEWELFFKKRLQLHYLGYDGNTEVITRKEKKGRSIGGRTVLSILCVKAKAIPLQLLCMRWRLVVKTLWSFIMRGYLHSSPKNTRLVSSCVFEEGKKKKESLVCARSVCSFDRKDEERLWRRMVEIKTFSSCIVIFCPHGGTQRER